MNLGAQIKSYRTGLSLSQEELAELVYVSRQSISNWENDKTYPDIGSLLRLSEVFHVSLDTLVKGDIETMKQEIDAQERATFQKDSAIFSVLLILTVLLPIPLLKLASWYGLAAYIVLVAVGLYYAHRVEKHKKKFDIQTYAEILAFNEGKTLSEIEKARESGKRPYQTLLYTLGAGAIGAVITAIMLWLLY